MRIWSTSTSRCFFFFSSRRRHTRCSRDWSSDVCSSDLVRGAEHVGWQGHWAVPESAPASRIPQVLDEFLMRSEEHTSELQSRLHLVCRLLLEKKQEAR